MKRLILALTASAALVAPSFAAPAQAPAAAAPPVPAGEYSIDHAHSTLVFRVSHLGFSRYTASFSKIEAKLTFDPAHPEASNVTASVDPTSLALPAPPAGFHDTLTGKDWLNAVAFPQIKFRSTKVEKTGANTARITGELSLHGLTQPIVLDATYNGGYAGNPYDPKARIGFSAHGAFKRSAFGIASGIPAPGTNMGVSDEVDVTIEAEFNGPPLKSAAK